jgi:hypothetical protein
LTSSVEPLASVISQCREMSCDATSPVLVIVIVYAKV